MPTADRFLITGCASGIGARVADALVARGHRVAASDINIDALEAHASDVGWSSSTLCERLDVTDAGDWQRVVDRCNSEWGGLDVLFNIAGYLQPGYLHEVDVKEVDRHFDINVKGVAFGMRSAAVLMCKQRSGHIVNIASMAAFAPIPGIALYSASKYAVRALSLAVATELSPHGVAVTVVCPDAVATPMLDKQKNYDEAAMTFTGPRVLTADEVCAELIGPVLDKRPLEVAIPRSRKWLARIVDIVPELGKLVHPFFVKQGLAKQKKVR
jgi:NADP-dependent 3-hydroxy acid dehydrogenase YdfG